jgi:carboxypeptidase family protein
LFLKYLIAGGILLIALGGVRAGDAASSGILEGHLKIVSTKPVELAETRPSQGAAVNYAEYPLVILSSDGQKKIMRVTANKNGDYRVTLPPGDYVLDAKGRAPGHVRATPQRFTVVSKQTVHVDFNLDTGVR